MKKAVVFILILILASFTADVFAQGCPMCKTALEEARNNGSSVGNTLNSGILYLLALPYLIASVFGIIWYKNARAKKRTAAL
ncbi:MAG: hypothetical protein V4658_10800 [Bacteroidota bacterium]